MTKAVASSGETLRNLRELAGMTQVEVATGAEISVAYLSRVEGGHMNPTLSYVATVMRAITSYLEAQELAGATPARARRSDNAEAVTR